MKKKYSTLFLISFGLIFLMFGCVNPRRNTELKDDHFTFQNLNYHELYYTYLPVYYDIYEPFDYVSDSSGVVISRYLELWYYNPVDICLKGINFYDRYANVQDSLYLDYAMRHRDTLIALMNEGYLFEYRMNYHHFDIYFTDPWYSGMAQGLALSLLSRLAFYADDTLSENLAHKIYQTLDPNSPLSHEVVDIDDEGYAWIEEYPGNPPDRTFNGFMHAIIGIYDYYHLLNPSSQVADILSVYLTTIRDHMYEYRNQNNISYYCLRHHHTDRTYHKIHYRQLNFFTDITLDSSFALFADTLKMDYCDW